MVNSKISYTGRGLGRERGFTLLEALIAGVVLGVGLLAAYRFNSTTIASKADNLSVATITKSSSFILYTSLTFPL